MFLVPSKVFSPPQIDQLVKILRRYTRVRKMVDAEGRIVTREADQSLENDPDISEFETLRGALQLTREKSRKLAAMVDLMAVLSPDNHIQPYREDIQKLSSQWKAAHHKTFGEKALP